MPVTFTESPLEPTHAMIIFPNPAGWPDALRPARSLGTGGA